MSDDARLQAARALVPDEFDWKNAGRRERVDVVRRLRNRGFLNREIGVLFGAAGHTVGLYFSDPDRTKRKAQLKRWEGVCVDCGGSTKYAGHKTDQRASLRCNWCARGMPRPKVRLCVGVRLTDVPVDVRMDAARDASRIAADESERLEILMAAISPSDRVYWVAESARQIVESWAA